MQESIKLSTYKGYFDSLFDFHDCVMNIVWYSLHKRGQLASLYHKTHKSYDTKMITAPTNLTQRNNNEIFRF
jgi:hypothetical protein